MQTGMSDINILRTTFRRHHLLLARLGWIAIFLLILSMIAANLPHVYRDTAAEWQVGEAMRAVLRLFPSRNGFLYTLITLRLMTLSIFIFIAFLLVWRKWDDWFVLYISATLLMLGYFFGTLFDIALVRYPQWLEQSFPAIRAAAPSIITINMVLFFYLFPNGRFTPRWLIWFTIPAILAILGVMSEAFNFSTASSDFFNWLLTDIQDWWMAFVVLLFGTIVIGLASQLVRYAQTPAGVARQQIKWVLFGLTAVPLIPLLGFLIFNVLQIDKSTQHLLSLLSETLIPLAIPITITFSVLRYRLWDVDVLVNRTLVFGGLTLLVTAVYILTVGLLSRLFQTGNSVTLSVLATGLIAILFNPLRQRLQTAVNRLMYGERDDPVTVLAAMGKRLEETAVPTETLPALVETIALTLKLPYVAIVGNREAGKILAASAPQPITYHSPLTFPLVYQSETIGELLVSTRSPGESFSPAEMRLLRNVAQQAGTAVYAAQLTADLQHSREQLVTAREEERRRLRRDLHDGLGPQLATLSLKLDAARNHLAHDPETSAILLAELKQELQAAIGDIRRVAHDLRPPALDQLGLVSAIREYAIQNSVNGLRISVTADPLPSLSAAVEVAAYRIILEAITNTVRHAQAKSCAVSLQIAAHLQLEVHDDGCGLAVDYQTGIGLSSMRERAAELGGTFQIKSTLGEGLHIFVQLPITQNQQSTKDDQETNK